MDRIDPLAQTGRTTRMLAKAFELARAGNIVCVLVHSLEMVRWLQEKQRREGYFHPAIQIRGPLNDFNWTRMQPRDAGPRTDTVWLADHVLATEESDKVYRDIEALRREIDRLQRLRQYIQKSENP